MKIKLFFISLIFFPIISVILINESQRSTHQPHSFKWKQVKTINSAVPSMIKCSWVCHNQTSFCKLSHVKHLEPYYSWTDPLYFGITRSLKATGNYGLANLIVLVLLIPGLCLGLLWQIVQYQLEIKGLRVDSTKGRKQTLPLLFATSVTTVYNYCTDFVIHVANLSNLSYYEINFMLFCILYPVLVFGLISIFIYQGHRWKRLSRKNGTL